MPFFVYILQSEKDQSFYIGYSSNPVKRLKDHNDGRSRYTRKKIPWRMVYQEEYESRSDAIIRERFLKNQKNSDFYNKLIESNK